MTAEEPPATFRDLGVVDWIREQLNGLGISKPTPVQENCIPAILEGRDCVGVAKTGQGKTFAFAIPILQQLSEDPFGIFALILTPTRELALQIGDSFRTLGRPMGLRLEVVVGGRDTVRQSQDLARRPHVVVATPGRLADHIENNPTFSLAKVRYLVMDEADRLLEGNFDEQLATIIPSLPNKRQTLLFTATNSPAIETTISACSNRPLIWQCPTIQEGEATVASLDQRYLLAPREAVDAYLVQLVQQTREQSPRDQVIVFCRTCKTTELIGLLLSKIGVPVSVLHSMRKQKERMSSLATFKSSQTKVLVATDVASRGLDIPEVNLVVNHNVPSDPVDYVHRVGRTARAGRGGWSVSLVTPQDVARIKEIEAHTKSTMCELELEDGRVAEIMVQVNTLKREADIELGENDFGVTRDINKRKKALLEGRDPEAEEKRRKTVKKKKAKDISKKLKIKS
jgi:ATP-dependent RNA helicase DDX49/DBP8